MSRIRLMVLWGLLFIVGEGIARQRGSGASLANEVVNQAERDKIDNRPVAEIVASTKPDRFTQTEAHLFLKHNRDLIEKKYPDTEKYLDVVSAIIAKEGEYKDSHYAFYNTTSNSWRLAQDLYTRLYAYEHPESMPPRDFKFLRFSDESAGASAQSFLINELKQKGLVDDNTDTKFIMISVNFALFGNVGFPGECSWEYFIHPQSHAKPIRVIYEKMMDRFGLTHKYIDELMKLVEIYETKEDTIVQVLVPIDKVDEIGYLAWVKGIPAHSGVIKQILQQAGRSKKFEKVSPAINALAQQFVNDPTQTMFKDMLEHVEKGDYSLEKFLKVYRNRPTNEMNDVTGRLLFTPDILLNPASGVKFFRFSTVTKEKLKEYNEKLNSIIKRMIAEKESGGVAKPIPAVKPGAPAVAPRVAPQRGQRGQRGA
jgi:hypothetical protein